MEQWEIENLDYKVRSIEAIVGVEFDGETIQDKLDFVELYWKDRMMLGSILLKESYEEMEVS